MKANSKRKSIGVQRLRRRLSVDSNWLMQKEMHQFLKHRQE